MKKALILFLHFSVLLGIKSYAGDNIAALQPKNYSEFLNKQFIGIAPVSYTIIIGNKTNAPMVVTMHPYHGVNADITFTIPPETSMPVNVTIDEAYSYGLSFVQIIHGTPDFDWMDNQGNSGSVNNTPTSRNGVTVYSYQLNQTTAYTLTLY